MRRFILLATLLAAATLAAPAPVHAAPRSISVVLIGADGVPGEPIDASDVQISLSRSAEAVGVDSNNMASISMEISALTAPGLLDWLGKGGETDAALITVEGRNGGTVYLLSGVSSRNANLSHSVSNTDGTLQVSLGSKHLSVNGNTVN